MKKFILFQSHLLILSSILLFSCFNNRNNNISIATITLTDISCEKCYEEISKIMKSNKAIKEFEIFQSNDKSTILINVKYNNKNININNIQSDLINAGYVIDRKSN